METYQIKRTKRKRIRTDYILLVPSVCFLEGNFQYSPLFLNSGGKYIWDKWEKYLIKDLGHEVLPCNYFFTRVNEDYLGIVGCPYFHPSYFVEDLVQAGVIDYKYLHSIVIMLDFNFNLYNMDKRFATQLSYKLLNPLLRMYKLQPDRIKFIDECYKEDWKDFTKYSRLTYHLTESEYFDFNQLMPYVHKYDLYNTL